MNIINLKGRPSKKLVEGEVYCGRAVYRGGWQLPKSKWANPFTIKSDEDREQVLERYREYLLKSPDLMSSLKELEGKTLACWCKPKRCHCDVIMEIIRQI